MNFLELQRIICPVCGKPFNISSPGAKDFRDHVDHTASLFDLPPQRVPPTEDMDTPRLRCVVQIPLSDVFAGKNGYPQIVEIGTARSR